MSTFTIEVTDTRYDAVADFVQSVVGDEDAAELCRRLAPCLVPVANLDYNWLIFYLDYARVDRPVTG